jgi:hypothetical protein
MDNKPDLDFPDTEEKSGFPWIPFILIILGLVIAAVWIIHNKSSNSGQAASAATLKQQLSEDLVRLEAERQRVIKLTEQLDAMKRAITQGVVPDKEKAVEEYNQVVKQQNASRDKVRSLSQAYNQKLAEFEALQ